jgi:hypothetical protein
MAQVKSTHVHDFPIGARRFPSQFHLDALIASPIYLPFPESTHLDF